MKTRVVVLGAGFAGLELAAVLSEALGDAVDVVLIDEAEGFVFGYSKLEVMFGRQQPAAVRYRYRDLAKPGVRFVASTVRAIDPGAKRVVTDAGSFDADHMVVALGAAFDPTAVPGLVLGENEFYTMAGAVAMRDAIARFDRGSAVVGVCAAPFKCPPAPSEAALLLHDHLVERGVRSATDLTVVMPFGTPVPPSPDTSQALLAAFAERGIRFERDSVVQAVDRVRERVLLKDGRELPCQLFLGVPVHRVPQVVVDSGLAAHARDWVPVDPATLETRFAGVYAVGDVSGVPTAKAGTFAESAARVVAEAIVARVLGRDLPAPYQGRGTCYVEFGHRRVARVEVDFLSGPRPIGTFQAPSAALAEEKTRFGASRIERWFGVAEPQRER